jgi:hypothetical protein
VGGDAVIYFNPFEVKNISQTIESFSRNYRSNEEERTRLKKYARQFGWQVTAQKTLAALLRL